MNSEEHIITAILVWLCMTLFGVMILGFDFIIKFPVQIIIGLVVTLLGSILPDILEPPVSSWHRSSFHSIPLLFLLTVLFVIFSINISGDSLIVNYGLIGYISHLLLDSTTPRGLPT